MVPAMQMTAPLMAYTPTSDALDRHEYGVSKNRKVTSTGGGRAWSEDEVRGRTNPQFPSAVVRHLVMLLLPGLGDPDSCVQN